ncbi:Gfo/Idh/MocA family protein [Lewinella sp. W8]|uniref:Gfo/Idh/MocA family protein n=1 Tax=Lewinella sp. W8 TaxID=2528208 RepID=UPI0015646B19|nr:Gfo/Idh/MocA family oxidoreductase [Lewinella sp. W8]
MSTASRRQFLRTSAATSTALFFPYLLRGGIRRPSPNARLQVGIIGCGRQAVGLANHLAGMEEAQLVAICDVYAGKMAYLLGRLTARAATLGQDDFNEQDIRQYADYRELLQHDGLDAVLIVTPDHQHGRMCVEALNRGLHVYCEKPLAHTIEEGRAIVAAVKASGKVLQTGSMQRSMYNFSKAVELIQAGKIGELRHAVVSIGPPPKVFDLAAQPVPEGLNWEAWVGNSVMRPYNQLLAPDPGQRIWAKWRDYAEYGGGMVTDWGAHMFDIVQWALGMDDSGPEKFFPPMGEAPQEGLTMVYKNGFRVDHRRFGRGNAIRFVGSEGAIEVSRGFLDSTIPGLIPPKPMASGEEIHTNVRHLRDWFTAIREGTPVLCPAETGHRSASVCTLTNIAYRTGKPIIWDPEKERITNDRKANKLLGDAYRTSLG